MGDAFLWKVSLGNVEATAYAVNFEVHVIASTAIEAITAASLFRGGDDTTDVIGVCIVDMTVVIAENVIRHEIVGIAVTKDAPN